MESTGGHYRKGSSLLPGMLRAALGIAGGILTIASMAVVVGAPLVMFVLPYTPDTLVLLLLPIPLAAGFFLGAPLPGVCLDRACCPD